MNKTFMGKVVMLIALLFVGNQVSAQSFLNKLKKATDKVTETVSSVTDTDSSNEAAQADTASVKVKWDKLPVYHAEMVYLLDPVSGDTLRNEDGTVQYEVALRDQFGNRRTPETIKAQKKAVNDAVAAILVKVGGGALIGGLAKGGKGAAIGAGVGALASAGDIDQAVKWKKVLKQQDKLMDAYSEHFTDEGKPKDASVNPMAIEDLSLENSQPTSASTDKIKEELNNRGIQMEGNNAAIRAAMSQLVRKDKNVKRTGRGCFEYIRNEETRDEGFHVEEKIAEVQDDDMIEMDKLEKQALEIIREAGEFDWINRSDEEVDRIRKKGKRQILTRLDIKLPQPFASWSNSL